jgi:prepilin peptidase CpaA
MVAQSLSLAVLGVLLALAAWNDVARRRIPNAIAGAIAACGLLAQGAEWGAWGAGSGAVAGLAVAVLLLGLWVTGKIGGGDLKLVAATSIWIGPARLPAFLLATGLAAGVLGLLILATSRSEFVRIVRAFAGAAPTPGDVASPRRTVPVAVAVAAAAAFVLLGRGA